MKKRYGLESIIGKKSALRFPRLVSNTKIDTISAILPANNAAAEPPFSTALTMKKGDSSDTCDQFNDLSYEYELDFPIRVDITISGPTSNIEVKTPSIFSLINIVYDLEDTLIENFEASITDISLNHANFALVKLDTEEDFFMSELLTHIKSIYSNILSYNCRRKVDKSAYGLLLQSRKRRFLANKNTNHPSNQVYNHCRNLHFFVKTKRFNKLDLLPLRFDHIETFYDILEDWDEFYDEYYKDQYLIYHDYLTAYSLLAQFYLLLQNNHLERMKLAQTLYYKKAILSILDILDTDSDFDSNLSSGFNIEALHSIEDVCLCPEDEDDYELDNDPFENAETIDDL
jgi:ribosomal protein L11